jgi:hypothetical protein
MPPIKNAAPRIEREARHPRKSSQVETPRTFQGANPGRFFFVKEVIAG